MNDIIGEKFGKLTVIEKSYKGKNGKYFYKCLCDCGGIKYVYKTHLKKGLVKSCGCIKHKEIDLTNKKFGNLTAIKKLDKKKNGQRIWLCKCDCGNIKEVRADKLRNGNVKSCGCLKKKKEKNKIKLNKNNIEFINPNDGIKYTTKSIKEMCDRFGLNRALISSKIRKGYSFQEAVIIQCNIHLNLNYNFNNFRGNLKEICNHFNKNFDDVYNAMRNNHTLEWAMEHAKDIKNERNH